MDTKHNPKLTAQERDLIAVWKGGRISLREIARKLGRSHSTIVEEIKRNSFQKKYYAAIHAQALAQERKAKAGGRPPLKGTQTYAYVLEKLRPGWFPEEIAGGLRKEQGKTVICHESIYRLGNKQPTKESFKLQNTAGGV